MKLLLLQFTKYASIGAIGTTVQYVILGGMVHGLSTDAVLASTIGYVIATFVNYYLNFRYNFRSNKRHNDALPKFFMVAIVGLGLNSGMMSMFIEYFHIHYFVAQILATGFVLFWTFGANRIWTFKEKHISMERDD